MTNHRVGKTNTRDPRGGWRIGKDMKRKKHKNGGWDSTNRVIRRLAKKLLQTTDRKEM